MKWSDYAKEFRYNSQLAIPVILGMLGHTFVSFIDNVMVGQLGTAELAAVSLGNSFMFVGMSLGIGFSTAITPIIAEADTAKNLLSGKSVLQQGLNLCVILGFVIGFGVYFSAPFMRILNQPEEVIVLAEPYLKIVG